MARRRLGEILLELGALDHFQLQVAFSHHQQWGMSLGQATIDREFCTPEQVLRALSIQTGLASVDLENQTLDPKLAALLSQKVAERHRAVPLRLEGRRQEVLVIAIAAPANLESLDAIQAVSGKSRIVPYVAGDEAIRRAIGILYLGLSPEKPKAAPRYVQPLLHHERVLTVDAPVTAPRPPRPSPVLVFGWHPDAASKVIGALSGLGIESRIASDDEVMGCTESDVVVAPLLALEAILPLGAKVRGQAIASGGETEEELRASKMIGTREFLAGAFSPRMLAEAVHRCRVLPQERGTRPSDVPGAR